MARLPDIGVSEWLTYQAQQFGEAARQVTEGGLFEIFASGPEFSVPQDLTMPWDVEPELADLAEEEARLEAQRRQQEFERQAEEARQYLAQQQQTYGGLNDGAVGHASQLGPAGAGGNLEAPTPGQNGAGGANPEVQAFLTQAGQIDQARGLVNPEVAAFQTAAGAIDQQHLGESSSHVQGRDPLDDLAERDAQGRDAEPLVQPPEPDFLPEPGPHPDLVQAPYYLPERPEIERFDDRLPFTPSHQLGLAKVSTSPLDMERISDSDVEHQVDPLDRLATEAASAPSGSAPSGNPIVAKLEEIGTGLANAFKGLAEALTSGANQANEALVGGLNQAAEAAAPVAQGALETFQRTGEEYPLLPVAAARKAGEVLLDPVRREEERRQELQARAGLGRIPGEGEPLTQAEQEEFERLNVNQALNYGAQEPVKVGATTARQVLGKAAEGLPGVIEKAGEFVGDLARAGGRGLRGPAQGIVSAPGEPYSGFHFSDSPQQFTAFKKSDRGVTYLAETPELATRGGIAGWRERVGIHGGGSDVPGQMVTVNVDRDLRVFQDNQPMEVNEQQYDALLDRVQALKEGQPPEVQRALGDLYQKIQGRPSGGPETLPSGESVIRFSRPVEPLTDVQAEQPAVQEALRLLGYDAVRVADEGGVSLAVLDPARLQIAGAQRGRSLIRGREGRYEFEPTGDPALRAEAERLSQGPRGRGGVPGAQGIVGEDTTRMYHGTGSAFDAPTADKFDANGLFGPGYYLTSDPRVAGSYAVERAMPNKNLRGTAALDPEVTAAGANVRPVDVPRGLRLFDVEAGGGRGWEADEELRDLIGDIGQMGRWDELPDGQRAWEDFEEALRYNANGEVPTNADVWHALKDAVGPTDVNRILANAGYDGIRYSGGRRIPMMDSTGKPIEHEVVVTFPESLQKIRNALSGTPGGLVAREQAEPNPVVSQALGRGLIGSGYGAVAGGIQAAQQEDADLGSVAAGVGRGAVAGAARGAIGGAAQAGLTRGQAGRLGALGMRAVPERAPGEGLDDAQRAQRVLRDQPLPPGALPITLSTPEEIGRLRLDKFPDEVREDVQQAATRVDWARDQRRGVLPDAVVAEMAEDLARRGDAWLAGRRPGRAFNPEETVAVRNLVTGQALKVRELTEEIASARASQTTPDLLIAQRAAEASKLDALVKLAEGARAEAGRALRQYRLETQLIELDPTQAVERIYKRLGGRDDALTKIDEYNTLVQQGADPFQMAHFWARVESPPPNFPEWFAALRYNSMLSGPRTFEINTIGNLSEVPWRLARDIGASTLRGRPEEIAPELVGLWVGAQKGAAAFMETLQHGITLEQATRGDMPRSLASRLENPAARGAATFLEAPGRLMQATDEFGRQLAYSMGLYRQAAIKASKTGKRGTEWGAEVARLAADPSEGMMRAAINIADRMTFKGEMGALGTALGGVQRVPVLGNILLPFLRTVYHLTARGVDRSPLGIVGTGIDVARGAYRGGQTPKGAAPLGERLGDNAMGMMGGLFLTGQAMQGNISGAGPDDPQKRDMLRAQGWQPYSVRIGNAWVSYANWGPAAIPFSLAAGVAESQLYRKPDATTAETVVDAFRRFGELTTEQTYFQGIGAFYKAVKEPDVYGSAWLTQFMQTLIPYGSAINTVGQATDPYARRPERFNVEQAMKARFPGLREQVPTATDPLGRSVENTMRGGGAFQPLRLSPEKRDPLLRTFSQAGVDIGAPPKELTVRGERVKLSESEKRYYQQVMAEYLSERYADAATAGDPQRALQRILREARERAERTIVRERP